MKRIAETTAPHPISGYDAHLEIFDAGADVLMRCTAPNIGIDTIIYPQKTGDAVMRETGLFWHIDADRGNEPVIIPALASAPAQSFQSLGMTAGGTVTVYDDGTGRALIQRVEEGERGMTFTWKSPERPAHEWIAINDTIDWHWTDAGVASSGEEPPPEPDADGFTADPDHVHFKALKLSIGWAVTYQDAKRINGNRSRGGMRWPVLVPHECQDEANHQEICETVAAILERNKAEMGAK